MVTVLISLETHKGIKLLEIRHPTGTVEVPITDEEYREIKEKIIIPVERP